MKVRELRHGVNPGNYVMAEVMFEGKPFVYHYSWEEGDWIPLSRHSLPLPERGIEVGEMFDGKSKVSSIDLQEHYIEGF